MAVEIAGSRAIAGFVGSTIYTWASGIGFTLLALSAGYVAGGIIADGSKGTARLRAMLFCAGAFTAAIPLILGTLMGNARGLDVIMASMVAGIALVPACVFYGMTSPFVIRLVSKRGGEGQSAGSVFAISTAGSVAGILGTGFILIPAMGLSSIFLALGGVMAASALAVGEVSE
jgi:hypothetical protein